MPHAIAVDYPARVLAQLVGGGETACDGVIVMAGSAPRAIAARIDANPLLDAADADPELDGGAGGEEHASAWVFDPHAVTIDDRPRLVSWSGSLASGLFDADPRNWGGPGRRALDTFCDRVRPALERHGWSLCFHPHARHVLSDARGCRDFLAQRRGQPFEVALAPASMLEASMLADVDDHLTRLFEALGPIAALVILEDVAEPQDAGAAVVRTSLGAGVLPRPHLRALLREHVPESTPVVIRGERVSEQREWLEG